MTNSNKQAVIAILPLVLVIFIDALGMGIMFPILNPLFMDKHGILPVATSMFTRDFLYGFTLMVFPLFMFFGAPLLGDWSDQIGRKKVILIGLIGAGISYCLSAYAVGIASISLLVISRCVAGITAGTQPIAQACVMDISAPENKARNVSLLLLPVSLGFTSGPVMGAYFSDPSLISWFNYTTPLLFAGLLSFLNCGLLVLLFKDTHKVNKKITFNLKHSIRLFTTAFSNKSIRHISVIMFFMQLGWACFYQFVSLFVSQVFHYSNNITGLFMGFLGLSFALGFLWIIHVVLRHFSEKKALTYAITISAIFTFVFTISTGGSLSWLSAFLVSVGICIVYSVTITLYSNSTDEDTQGWIMGISTAVMAVGWVISSLFTGFIAALGIYATMITAAIFLSICAYASWRYLIFAGNR